jgi:hypothetical protein
MAATVESTPKNSLRGAVLQVRRAHRAAYVSNLLRKKPRTLVPSGGDVQPNAAAAAETNFYAEPDSDDDDDVIVDEQGEVVLTQQQEAEFELQLQQVLQAAEAGKKGAVLPLELAHLSELLQDGSTDGSSATLAALGGSGLHGSSTEEESDDQQEEEEQEEQAPVWKVISTPKAVPKVKPAGLLAVVAPVPRCDAWRDVAKSGYPQVYEREAYGIAVPLTLTLLHLDGPLRHGSLTHPCVRVH